MTAIALDLNRTRTGTARAVISRLVQWRITIAVFAIGFPIVFYLLLLGILIVKYGNWPNYVTQYDWIGDVLRIIHTTPSVHDMVPIILNEWLLEIGYIDYQYGHGVAEWSLSIIPHKLVIMSLAGALIGLNVALLLERHTPQTLSRECTRAARSGFLTCFGAVGTGLTSATVYSVACCAAPSWAGSLSILGVDTSVAFGLEPFGPYASLLGMLALLGSALWIARDNRSAVRAAELPTPHEVQPC